MTGAAAARWARLGVRGQQLAASVAVAVVGLAVFGVVAAASVEDSVVARIEDELWRTAGVCGVALAADGVVVDDVVDAVAAAAGARVTVVDAAGVVVGDSGLDGAALAAAAPHGDRPEVIAARASGRGVARRKSATVSIDSLYVARQVGALTVRASLPLHAVDDSLRQLRMFFGGAFAVALIVAIVGALAASTAVSRRLRALLADVKRLRAGNDAKDGDGADDDDVATLARTFESMAAALERNVRALASERDRVSSLLEAMDEGVIALDDDGNVVLCNRAARDLLGLTGLPQHAAAPGPLGPRRDVLGAPLALPALAAVVDDARAGKSGSVEIAVDVAVDGDAEVRRQRRVLVRATGKGEHQAVVLVAHDVSEVRRLETLRKDFVANVSHELRTPCSVILANAETLLSGAIDDGPRALKFVEAVHRNAERLSRLISDLLELSKIEAGKAVFSRVPVDVREAVEHVVDAIEPRAREKDIALAVDVDPDLLIEGDPKALDQVLINLVDNAVKYTPSGGHVKVHARQASGARAQLIVEDDGPGVEGKHKERLFERFYRVDSGRSRDVGGTGLGLAIVKHLVEAMDGTVSVDDAVPHGTRFCVELPIAGSARAVSLSPPSSDGGRRSPARNSGAERSANSAVERSARKFNIQ